MDQRGRQRFLTVGFAALRPLMAHFYHDPLVKTSTEGMSLTILVSSLSVIHLALLNRAMRFTAVSANTAVARAVSVLVSIVLALGGLGLLGAGCGLYRATTQHVHRRLVHVPLDSQPAPPRSWHRRGC